MEVGSFSFPLAVLQSTMECFLDNIVYVGVREKIWYQSLQKFGEARLKMQSLAELYPSLTLAWKDTLDIQMLIPSNICD
ncbi:uncharacterized protein LOC143838184 isoform X2 [Paroedura picta]|uniref:uncharacterized protein LOC143838184 isoform X2 n=1 Tax=Paroedura picta TaxID=143630 RepID=UPI00405619EB